MTRSAVCRDCGGPFIAQGSRGRLPSICDVCSPEAAARRQGERARREQRLSTFSALEAKVAMLERMLAGLGEARPVADADRQTVARAVRRLAEARGTEDTRQALLHLRNVAQSWADILNESPKLEAERTARRAQEEAA